MLSFFEVKEEPYIMNRKAKNNDSISKIDIKQDRLILNPNDFLDNQIVFYFERKNNSLINSYISRNHVTIAKAFSEKGLKLVHIPSYGLKETCNNSKNELIEYLRYKHPHVFKGTEKEISEAVDLILSNVDLQLYYNSIGDTLGIPDDQSPCFIHSIDLSAENNHYRKWEYSCFINSTTDEELIAKEIEFYRAHLGITTDIIFYSLSKEDKLNYDADERFEFDGKKVCSEVSKAINQIKSITNEKLLVTSMLYLIESLKKSNPFVCEKISLLLLKRIETSSAEPSKLIIDEQFRIWLPDFNNIEIEMPPLPKAFYIFMLKHPEGISFKHLSEYNNEILEIYSRIANRYDLDKIKKSIKDITNIRSNSVNEKCSRIKEAFLLKIDDSIAQNYYITGGRNELKSIKLNSSLIHFPKNL